MTDDKALIKKAQKGDTGAFEKILKNYENVIYGIAYRYAGSQDDAADMAQEIFIKMFRNINGFRFKSKLSTWIYRVAVNTCIDMIKKSDRDKAAYSLDDGYTDDEGEMCYGEIADTSLLPDEVIIKGEVKDAVNTALSCLSEDYRTVIILRDMQGLTYDEIAEVIDCSVGTVKSRISRGRKNLREILSQNRELFEKYYV